MSDGQNSKIRTAFGRMTDEEVQQRERLYNQGFN